MKWSVILGALLFAILLPNKGLSQDTDSTLYRVEMKNGNVFFGTFISEDEEFLVIHTEEAGDVELKKSSIKSREIIDPERFKDGEFWFENPQSTHYLFGTSGIGLKKGEGYYQNAWVFFNNVNYGITDNFSLGGGMVPTFLFGASATPIWVIPKVSIPLANNNLHAAVGGLFGGVIGDEENFGMGLAYGVLSIGNQDDNLTFGIGYGYADKEWSDIPIFTISGMHRLNRNWYIISENYFIATSGETLGLLSAALRWAPENFAVDFGLFRPTNVGTGFIGAPWLGVSIPFGN